MRNLWIEWLARHYGKRKHLLSLPIPRLPLCFCAAPSTWDKEMQLDMGKQKRKHIFCLLRIFSPCTRNGTYLKNFMARFLCSISRRRKKYPAIIGLATAEAAAICWHTPIRNHCNLTISLPKYDSFTTGALSNSAFNWNSFNENYFMKYCLSRSEHHGVYPDRSCQRAPPWVMILSSFALKNIRTCTFVKSHDLLPLWTSGLSYLAN